MDFIYSNSFDHSYDPERCLNAWMRCVKPGGLCILEYDAGNTPAAGDSALDPFRADLVVLPYLIATWGEGRYGVRWLLKAPHRNPALEAKLGYALENLYFIIIQRY